MSTDSDHLLMQAVARGSTEALGELYRRHHVALFTFFRRHGRSRVASEDLVHDTWLRVLTYADSYGDQGRFVPWMYRIARNVLVDSVGRDRKGGHVTTETAMEAIAASGETPEARLLAEEVAGRLDRALGRLSPEKRELVLLSRVRQLALADLAQLFACSVPALKVRLHRSLRQLRDYFDEEGRQAGARGNDENGDA